MTEEHLNKVAPDIIDEIGNFEQHELKGFHSTIANDIRTLLIESNPNLLLNNSPELTVVLVTNIYSTDPCSACSENLSNMSEWSNKNNLFDNRVRILLLDAIQGFDDKKIWDKLKLSFDDVPLTLFFDSNFGLIDIVQGVLSVNYLEMFWTPHFQ